MWLLHWKDLLNLPRHNKGYVPHRSRLTFTDYSLQDGKPYIISMQAGAAEGSVREQGFNFVTKSVFKTKEDMKFYETGCAGHNNYKAFLKANAPVAGLMMVCFTPGYSYAA
jgi:hypothetical protein